MENGLFITASYLDIRTKLFSKCSDAMKKEFINIAKTNIRSIVEDFPSELKEKIQLTDLLQATNTRTQASQQNIQLNNDTQINVKKNRLQIFDYNKEYNNKKWYVKLNSLEKEFYKYNVEPSKNVDPSEFWKSNKENYSILYQVFLRVFCIPATSVPAEQLFSAAGYSIWDRRNKITPDNVNKIMTE